MADEKKSSYQLYIDNATISQENYSASLTPEQISNKFVNFDKSTTLYRDTVFYLHLYNSLYLALYKFNDENNNDVAKFKDLFTKLKIVFDKTTAIPTSPATSIGVLVTAGSGTVASPYTYTFTYYTTSLITAYSHTIGSVTNGQVLTYTATTATVPVYTKNSSGVYTKYDGTADNAYKAGITLYTLTFTPALSTDFTTPETNIFYTRELVSSVYVYTKIATQPTAFVTATNSDLTTTNTGTPSVITVATDTTSIAVYKKTTTSGVISYPSINTVIYRVLAPTIYTFNLTAVSSAGSVSTSSSDTPTIDINAYYNDYLKFTYKKYLPVLTSIGTYHDSTTLADVIIPDTSSATIYLAAGFSKSTTSLFVKPETKEYTNDIRQQMLKYILKDILSNNSHETIMGYLMWNKINFNINLYKLSIQYIIRANYLQNARINTNKFLAVDDFFTKQSGLTSVTPVLPEPLFFTSASATAKYGADILLNTKTYIDNMKTNIETLKSNNFDIDTNDYLSNKYQYTTKIENLTNIKTDYEKIQNSLNIAVKEYNKHLKNFTNIKQYASYVVIFLIILIIATIIITILPTITPEIKSTYYVITFIILSIVTYLFYNTFNHVNLYEKFTIQTDPINYWSDKTNYAKNHYYFYNNTIANITAFNDAVKELTNKVRNNIYTVGDKTFTVDANTYLYKLYLEKKNQLEVNRLKKVSLTNFIESMKKQVLYLFNIIVFISNLIIILLLGLMLYSGVPFLLPYIIVLCVILTVILVVYFMIAIIQPTRMIASKNYWANNRPDADLLNNL
jgi:hypothetical protein